jgi:hypothetical protein
LIHLPVLLEAQVVIFVIGRSETIASFRGERCRGLMI